MTVDFPCFEKFSQKSKVADIVAVCVPLPFDHETAVTLANRFVNKEYMFLLESATAGPGSVARYSFLGFDPLWTFKWSHGEASATLTDSSNGNQTKIALEGASPMAALRKTVTGKTIKAVYPDTYTIGGPDVGEMGGVCGFFGYDVAHACEPSIGSPLEKKLNLPDAVFYLPKMLCVLDHFTHKLHVIRHVIIKDQKNIQDAYDSAIYDLQNIVKDLQSVQSPPPLQVTQDDLDFESCEHSFAKTKFLEAAEECLEEVRSGEIFQVQIGNRLTRPVKARAFDVFRHLRSLNPSPYMFFFKFGEDHILGSSPEMMVNVSGGKVTHRPIAGTRKRTWNAAKDRIMREELMGSEKERAEHVMLVDLGRNDVGRIAAAGTVEVEELMTVEEYSHVFHMVSQVSGNIKEGLDAFDALVSGFPNGTVSGAPKIRAMQIINSKEKISREFYAGSLGLFDFHGDLKSTILIRTIHMARGTASTQASAGIVFDSIPEQEWQETRNKMAACLTAMQNTR